MGNTSTYLLSILLGRIMEIRCILEPSRDKRLIYLFRLFPFLLVKINIHTPGEIQVAVDVLFSDNLLQCWYVRNLKVRDFSPGLDTISFDILWNITI
jgi:hypothetical protein